MPDKNRDLSFWYGLVLPLASVLFFVGSVFIKPDFWRQVMGGELGVVENAQFVILSTAFYFGIRILLKPSCWPGRWFGLWVGILTAGLFYIAGEEISWGQHYLFWQTPEWFQTVNSQNETNLHNIRFLKLILDKLPFRTLEAVVFWGGVVYPVLLRFIPRLKHSTAWYVWLLPSAVCFPAACAAQLVQIFRMLDPLRHFMRTDFPWLSLAELKEYFVYLFLFVYMDALYDRLRQANQAENRVVARG